MNLRNLGAASVLATAAALAVVPHGPAAADPTAPAAPTVSDPPPTARAAADEVVAARAPQLHLGPHDAVHAKPTLRSDDLRFVPYERTHRGLPVVGGDFVVVVDGAGDVVHLSVAQTDEVQLPDVVPSVAAPVARTKSAAKVTRARLGRSRLVVLQRGDRSDLAWRTTASGRRDGEPSRLDVYVDADSGQVLETSENVQHGEGNPGWSGPAPVRIDTLRTGPTYAMTTPGATTLTCQDSATNRTFTGPDDVWGNGNPASKETGCVDALYGAQQMKLMLSRWLGRDGMDAMGDWLPIKVGIDDVNAYYDGTQVQIGHNTSGQWLSAIDIVAHEYGHGIDDHTPGGISNGNTSEFVADVFGTATEWFDNQPAPYDTRDFLIGEQVDFDGTGEIRNMHDPSLENDPSCYSATVGNPELTGVHSAAGPGNHWFYLAAIGSNAAGQPQSPTCNGARVHGIGVPKLMKIMYTAMLMKTSASSYPMYRQWTLIAARQLYGASSCVEFNRVKAAWNAVSVPAQPGEGTCTPGQDTLRVTNATSRTATAGTTIFPFTMTATGGTGPYAWSASGLPAGLTIGSNTGEVDGSLGTDTAGSYVVTVTAIDQAGQIARGSFTMTVNGSPSPFCTGQRLGNAGFENQTRAPWNMPPWLYEGTRFTSRSGLNHVVMGGMGVAGSDTMSQEVRIPEGCRATLTFYVSSRTDEAAPEALDTLTVRANSYTLLTRSNLDACLSPCANSYVQVTKVLPAFFAGRTVTLSWTSQENAMNRTSWYVDDVAVTITPVP
ncbi:M4 family metallopeptidase [Nocardioides antri]|uniref:M4 family peptidase n=1 Tax=Nocardioides antri TaxID=2607659 RepID=A0A5B1LUZ0_9ACTN|nr:M4 family metallopeptidase [Nocardioides antri]KAA1424336.1 M4 family peptidase [Nocardioides antri]